MSETEKPLKRKRRCTVEESVKKRKRAELLKTYSKSRIILGSQFQRWREVQKEMKLTTDKRVAKYLLDMYHQRQCATRPATSTEIKVETDSSEKTMTGTEHLPETDIETGGLSCLELPAVPIDNGVETKDAVRLDILNNRMSEHRHTPNIYAIRGLPLNVPFTVHFNSPYTQQAYDSEAYIILEYRALNLDINVAPVHINITDNIVETIEAVIRNNIHDDITKKNSQNTWVESIRKRLRAPLKRDHSNEGFVKQLLDNVVTKAVISSEKARAKKERLLLKRKKGKQQLVNTSTDIKPKKRGRKASQFAVEFKKQSKLVKIEEEELDDDESYRKSSRLRSKGFRPDYSAFDDLDEMSDLDESHTEAESEDGVSDDQNEEEIGEPDSKCLFADKDNVEDHVEDVKESSDGNLNEKTDESNEEKTNLMKRKKDPDPDFDVEELFSRTKRVRSVSLDGGDGHTTSSSDLSEEDSENEFDSDSEYRKKRAREQKMKSNLEKMKKRIKIKLDEHSDKYYEEEQVSIERKDRAKSKEEKLTKLLVCALCKIYRTINKSALEEHIEEHVNGDYDCDQCDFSTNNSHALKMHKIDVHKKKKLKCSECDEKFGRKSLLYSHLLTVHKINVYACKYCSNDSETVSFTNWTSLTGHLFKHHKDKMQKCEKCNSYFKNTRKNRNAHGDNCQGEIACDVCGKLLKGQGSLKAHIRTVHQNIRRFPCSQCTYAAKSDQKLRDHVTAIHEGTHNVKCDQCDFTCVQSYQLVSHQRTHTGDKPFKCDQCSYAAAWNVQLKDHKRLHGLPCSVACDICGILLKNDKCCRLHKKKEHSDDPMS